MSQMSISSQLSKNNSIRHHTRSETPSQHQHSATPTPRESIVFNRGDEKPIAKILLSLNHSLKFNQSKDKNNEEDENQKLVESNYNEIESKDTSHSGSVRSIKEKENKTNNNLSNLSSTSMGEFRSNSDEQKSTEDGLANKNSNSKNNETNTKNDLLIKTKIDQFNSFSSSSIRQNNESYSNAIKNLVFDKNSEENNNNRAASEDLVDEEVLNLSKDVENTTHLSPNYEEFLEFERNKKKNLRSNKTVENSSNVNDTLKKETKQTNSKQFLKNPDKSIILQPNGDQNYNLPKNNDSNGGRIIKNESKSDISISHSFSKKCFKCCTIS
jgi:hypothetical protein